jgi:hypothetical protein
MQHVEQTLKGIQPLLGTSQEKWQTANFFYVPR